jgi:alpha/beta hydrolase family protein
VTAALVLASLVGVPMKARANVTALPTGGKTSSLSVPSSAAPGKLSGPVASEPEAGGTHTRLETRHGPVHLFRPAGFDRKTAGVVVYVHGYYTHIDEAWQEHKLAQQFAASRRNALFVAPEAPAAPEEAQSWTSLRRLLATVLRSARVGTPAGPIVVVGHSGAYRTLVLWLNEPSLHQLILVDALYGNEPDFLEWLARERSNHMTLVVKGTAKWADPFVRKLPYAMTVPQIPSSIYELSREQRAAKLLCLRSQYGHFELITEGRTLPVLLGRGGLRPIPRPHPRKS